MYTTCPMEKHLILLQFVVDVVSYRFQWAIKCAKIHSIFSIDWRWNLFKSNKNKIRKNNVNFSCMQITWRVDRSITGTVNIVAHEEIGFFFFSLFQRARLTGFSSHNYWFPFYLLQICSIHEMRTLHTQTHTLDMIWIIEIVPFGC